MSLTEDREHFVNEVNVMLDTIYRLHRHKNVTLKRYLIKLSKDEQEMLDKAGSLFLDAHVELATLRSSVLGLRVGDDG